MSALSGLPVNLSSSPMLCTDMDMGFIRSRVYVSVITYDVCIGKPTHPQKMRTVGRWRIASFIHPIIIIKAHFPCSAHLF